MTRQEAAMFVAVWWRLGSRFSLPEEECWAGLMARPCATRASGPNTLLVAWPPASMVRLGQAATAYPAVGRSGDGPPGHPSARLDGDVLTISAGPLPQHPLYYTSASDGGYFVACSRLGPLAALFPATPIDGRRLVSLIAYGADTDTDASPYAGIQRLRPCEEIVVDGDGPRVRRDFPRVAPGYRRGKPRDLAAELRHRLDAAVERAMGASRHVAVLVSGGLDSSGVLALAAARCRRPPITRLDALSIHYAGPGDDRPHLAELTDSLGLVPVRLPPAEAAPWFGPSLCMDAQPGNLASTSLLLMASAAARRLGADVVLTGVSGDAISGGTLPFGRLTHLARSGRWATAMNRALRLRIPWPMSPLLRLRYVFSPLLPGAVRRIKRRLVGAPRGPSWLTARSGALLARSRELDERVPDLPPDTPDAWMRHLCTRGQLADSADALGQLATLTGCFPVDIFRDAEFVRFMIELDPVLLSHDHEYRGLYRLAMRGLLPERLRTRRDKGFFEPAIAAAAVASGALDTLRDLSSLDALATCGLADPGPLRPMFESCFALLRRGEREQPLPGDEHLQEVWQMLSAEAFLRENGRGRAIA